ncbi:hypothetical protein FB381_1043 [Nocardioides albertanoniae]|uniref:Peptidase inhibitor family I36 n=1 Tax=Nocardioides albertanoniae TaxID=1175486 RepID=A0A543A3K7_9ACTN|nr:hypothetical protein [Nocardioides albertanoniae]TQL67170.1 hypothetical protein FB381_1043 [Nocardioides albertanoniae]
MIKRIIAVAALSMAATTFASGAVAATDGSRDVKSGGSPEPVGTAAHSPSVSPAAEKTFHKKGGLLDYNCPKGRLCVDAWDPVKEEFKIFQFYQCKTYSLKYFGGYPGIYVNDQTGGEDGVAKFLTKSGKAKVTSQPVNEQEQIDWDPIWYIKSCPS